MVGLDRSNGDFRSSGRSARLAATATCSASAWAGEWIWWLRWTYHNLHSIMKVNGRRMIPPVVFHDNQGDPVTLEHYSDDHHGFLRVAISDQLIVGRYYQVPRPQEPWSKGNQLVDRFEFDWRNRRYIPNTL